MNALTNYLKGIALIYVEMANAAYPTGAIMTCKNCGQVKRLTTEQCAVCLRDGWEKCCGQDMMQSLPDAERENHANPSP